MKKYHDNGSHPFLKSWSFLFLVAVSLSVSCLASTLICVETDWTLGLICFFYNPIYIAYLELSDSLIYLFYLNTNDNIFDR